MRLDLSPLQTFLVGGSIFLALLVATELSLQGIAPLFRNVVFKAALAALCLLLMKMDGRNFSDFGFRRACGVRWGKVVGSGLVLGALTTAILLASPGEGHKLLQGATLGQIVLAIWVWSSLTEEIFTRGLLQTWTRAGERRASEASFSQPVRTTGLFFGAMHLSLLQGGTDAWTVGILVLATALLGLLAGRFRELSGSLLPAFVLHLFFNVGGFLGAAVWMITSRLLA